MTRTRSDEVQTGDIFAGPFSFFIYLFICISLGWDGHFSQVVAWSVR